MSLALPVARRMLIRCTPTVTASVFHVTPGPLGKGRLFTIIKKCNPMSNYADQPNGCINDVSPKRSASSTESTKTENFYASIISATLEYFKVAK